MEWTGLDASVEKPPVAPKPKVFQPQRPILHSPASKLAPDLHVSPPPKIPRKPAVAPKPHLPKTPAPPIATKPTLCNSSFQTHFQQKSDNARHVDLLNSWNGPNSELKKPEWDYVIPICVCTKGKCQECSPKENDGRPMQHEDVEPCVNNKPEGFRSHVPRPPPKPQQVTEANKGTSSAKNSFQGSSSAQTRQKRVNQSPGAVKLLANGLVESELHTTEKPQSSVDNADELSPTVVGSPPKTSKQALTDNKQHQHVSSKQNISPPFAVAPVRKPPLLPVHKKPRINHAKFLDKADTVSEDPEGSAQSSLKVAKLNESILKEKAPITPLKPPVLVNKIARGVPESHLDDMIYLQCRSPSSEQRQNQDVCHAEQSDDAAKMQQLKLIGLENEHSDVETHKVHKKQRPIFMNLPKQPKEQRNQETNSGKEATEGETKHVGSGLSVSEERKLGGKPFKKILAHSEIQEPNNSMPENSPAIRSGASLKPKSKSFSLADRLQKKTCSKIMDLDVQVPEYKTHLSRLHSKELVPNSSCPSSPKEPNECNINGHDVQEEPQSDHLYEDISDVVYCSVIIPGIRTQPTNKAQHRQFFSNDNLYETLAVSGGDGYERNLHEETVSSDDTRSEEETDSGSEVEDNCSSHSDKGQDDAKRTKLAHIAKEIMTSEKVFVDVLKLLHVTFREAVAKASIQAGKAVIDERILNQILFSLPQLYELNCALLSELESRLAKWNEHPVLADVFLNKGPYLKMYSSYICEFDKNVALLEEQCRKNPAFAKVVQEFENNPYCANLAVKHYMLKPVQRLPQYQLLLTDYLKNLNEDSPDYKDTQAALKLVKNVAIHANETMRQGDNFQKLMQIQCSLLGNHEIVQPGRVLLKEGTLMKLSRKVMQPRMFFLFNDMLLYTRTLQSGQHKLNNALSLAGMKVSKPSQEAYQNELNIESVERSFILSASSPAIRDAWLEAISAAIDNYTKKMISFGSSKSHEEGDREGFETAAHLGSKAPIWIPDLRVTMCMICTCEFTLTWRRHHCRACGKVVCQACSTNRYPLEYLKNRPARVCDQCFDILKHESAASNNFVSPNSKFSGGFHFRKQKKIPSALKEVSANTDESSMSGYMERMKANKKQWKRLWFVIKNKVLYTYAASEDVAALESLPLLGFSLKKDKSESSQQFQLYHKDKLFYIFRTDDTHICQRWIKAIHDATVL